MPPTPPPGFTPGIPLLGRQRHPTAEEAAEESRRQIALGVQQLTMSIYIQAASSHVATRDRPIQQSSRGELQQLAKDSQEAARAFFEGLGVAEFSDSEERET